MKPTIIAAIKATLQEPTNIKNRESRFLQKGVSFHVFLSTQHPDKNQFQSKLEETIFNSEFDKIKKIFRNI